MTLSLDRFHLLARLIGGVLVLMGASLLAVFGAYLSSGVNPLAPGLPLNDAGMVILATVGAFQLPLGLSLLGRDARTSFRLRVAAGALGLMAALRLLAFLDPSMQATLGITPLLEAAILGSIAAIALVARPENEAPIEIVRVYTLDVPAARAWEVMAERFGEVAAFASGVRTSTLDGPPSVGAVRTCQTEPFGPFGSSQITETLTVFQPGAMRFAYVAGGDLPAFIPSSTNRWSVEPVGPTTCRVRSHASIELLPWAIPMAPLLAWSIGGAIDRFGKDLHAHLQRIPPHAETRAS